MTKGTIEQNIFTCYIRINGAKRCFTSDESIAILEMQKMHYEILREKMI